MRRPREGGSWSRWGGCHASGVDPGAGPPKGLDLGPTWKVLLTSNNSSRGSGATWTRFLV